MRRVAIAALVIGVLVVLARLIGQSTDGGATAAAALPPDLDTTFNGVKY
jgi:hypothetical protein